MLRRIHAVLELPMTHGDVVTDAAPKVAASRTAVGAEIRKPESDQPSGVPTLQSELCRILAPCRLTVAATGWILVT